MGASGSSHDEWAKGELYEPYVGRWSRAVAVQFLQWLSVPAQAAWLDVGCGTGALSQSIVEYAAPRSVKGVDRSEGYVQFARSRAHDGRASFEVGEAQSLAVNSDEYDAVVSGLVLNFVPEPVRMVSEMSRAARPGGTVALYVWDYAGKMQLMRQFWDAAAALDPGARALDEGSRFPICNPGPLHELFTAAGLSGVQVVPIDIDTPFKDFDDYWGPFLGGQGPAPAYAMSLSEQARERLRETIRNSLPISDDGSIRLVARAWAVKGSKQA